MARTGAVNGMNASHAWSLVAAVWFGAWAVWFDLAFFGPDELSVTRPMAPADGAFAVAVIVAACFVGGLSWLAIAESVCDSPLLGGLTAGLVTGVFIHPVTLFVWGLLHGSVSMAFVLSLGSVWGLLLFGWVSIPLGIFAGTLLGAVKSGTNRVRNGLERRRRAT